MGCIFALVCGRNPGACCHECELPCFKPCKLAVEECDFYDDGSDGSGSWNNDTGVCNRKQ